jgi:xanthosine phosphorylase
MAPGSLMLISDHINMTGVSPLLGPNDDSIGPRFFSLEEAYDPALRARLRDIAKRLNVPLREGVYLAYLGPNYETPAEIRAFASWGADAVGMSTVPEVIVARHCGLRVAAISVITNAAAGLSETLVAHDRVLDVAAEGGAHLVRLLKTFLAELAAAS